MKFFIAGFIVTAMVQNTNFLYLLLFAAPVIFYFKKLNLITFALGTIWSLLWVPATSQVFFQKKSESMMQEMALKSVELVVHTERVEELDSVKSVVLAIVTGNKEFLSKSLKLRFKNLGIYHLLVVSGMHVAFFAAITVIILEMPFRLFNILALLSPYLWTKIQPVLILVSAILTLLYCAQCGFSPATQRASLLFVSFVVFRFSKKQEFLKIILFAMFLQVLFFPKSILETGNVLSWTAYIFVVDAFIHKKSGLKDLLRLQVKFFVLTLTIFGWCSPISLLANLMVTPLFPLIYFSALSSFFIGPEITFVVVEQFLNFLEYFDRYLNYFSPVDPNNVVMTSLVQPIALIFTAFNLLNCLANLSIGELRSKSNESLGWQDSFNSR